MRSLPTRGFFGAKGRLVIPNNVANALLVYLLHRLCQGVATSTGQIVAWCVLEPAASRKCLLMRHIVKGTL